MFQRMTDMYGDCPYSQAGLGYISGITSPKYDKQQDIYTDLPERAFRRRIQTERQRNEYRGCCRPLIWAAIR